MTSIRPAVDADMAAVADLWHEGWQHGHTGHVPDGLTAERTLPAFHKRTPSRVAAGGHATASLAVVVGNTRARRFYERQGWVDRVDLPYEVSAGGQTFVSPCRRYVKGVALD